MVIVIGGSSFIGVYTVNALLEAGVKVLATGRNMSFKDYYNSLGVDYLKLDLTCKDDFKKLPTKNVEGVILLASLLPVHSEVNLDEAENAADYFAINTIGTINVLEYCRVNKIKRVISTISIFDVYKSWKKDYAITEEEPSAFPCKGDHAAYTISKKAACDIIEYYNQQHGMSNAVFRLSHVYGVGPHGSLFVNGVYKKSGLQVFIDNAMSGDDIKVFGDKDMSRDVVYVKDVAEAFKNAMLSEKTHGLYNITSGRAVTLEQQAKVIAKVFAVNKQSKIVYCPEVKNISDSYLFDISKAKRDFGYEPHFADFSLMMEDYKHELERGVISHLFE